MTPVVLLIGTDVPAAVSIPIPAPDADDEESKARKPGRALSSVPVNVTLTLNNVEL